MSIDTNRIIERLRELAVGGNKIAAGIIGDYDIRLKHQPDMSPEDMLKLIRLSVKDQMKI